MRRGAVRSKRRVDETNTVKVHYNISSLPDGAARTAEHAPAAVRSHRRIENRLDWLLDVVFREEKRHVRRDYANDTLRS